MADKFPDQLKGWIADDAAIGWQRRAPKKVLDLAAGIAPVDDVSGTDTVDTAALAASAMWPHPVQGSNMSWLRSKSFELE